MVTRGFVAPLFVPGNRPERFAKAAASGADAIILDLEDAVAAQSRPVARASIAARGALPVPVIVRVNPGTTPDFEADLECLRTCPPEAVMLAKCEGEEALARIRQLLGENVALLALVETVKGMAQLESFLTAPGVTQAVFGSLDYAGDLGCEPTWGPLQAARAQLVFASRLAGLHPPLDGVSVNTQDAALVEAETRKAREWGFGGKFAIHPAQIAPIFSAFLPTSDELAWARKVVAASPNGGAVSLDGRMIDKPVIDKARRTLALAEPRERKR